MPFLQVAASCFPAMGRPRKPLSSEVLERASNSHNDGRLPSCISDPRQFHFSADCSPGVQHFCYCTVQWTVRAVLQHGGLHCPTCNPTKTQRSRHVPAVQAAISQTGYEWRSEVRWLRGNFSSVDFWFPAACMGVHVDGCGHTDTAVHSKSLAQQQLTDWRFDNECVRQGKRALRLHWRDCGQPAATLAAALAHADAHPQLAFVMYSSSYGRETKTGVDQEYLDWLARAKAEAGGGSPPLPTQVSGIYLLLGIASLL